MSSSKTLISLLGSTGSIGTQTLDVVRSYPQFFEVELLCGGNNWELLLEQAREFKPRYVVISNEMHYAKLRNGLCGERCEVLCGSDALDGIIGSLESDVVVVAIVGFAGLAPTISAIKAGKRIALANKECLVVGGDIIMSMAVEYGVDIMPIDSEHSAIFQCLLGELSPLRRILLTASGGALRDLPLEEFEDISLGQVLHHPTWNMGARITVDSATMLNKGFEVIEAAHLFHATAEQIQVVIHPESIIHSAVEFYDTTIKAQMSYPDMRLAIQYALTYPERMEVCGLQSFDPFVCSELSFRKPEPERYPCLGFAYDALRAGGTMPVVLNASAEVAVDSFLCGRIKFTDIARTIGNAMEHHTTTPIGSLEDIYETDASSRRVAEGFIAKI